jgi:hypothetical protein
MYKLKFTLPGIRTPTPFEVMLHVGRVTTPSRNNTPFSSLDTHRIGFICLQLMEARWTLNSWDLLCRFDE